MTKRANAINLQIDPAYRRHVAPKLLQSAAQQALQHQQAKGQVQLTIVITDDERIQTLNRQYRRVDAPTDVLAFANAETAETFVAAPDEPAYLGDVIISYPRAEAQAQAAGHPLKAELQLLVVHGVLHLLGHDHATPAQKRKMWAAQAEILNPVDNMSRALNQE